MSRPAGVAMTSSRGGPPGRRTGRRCIEVGHEHDLAKVGPALGGQLLELDAAVGAAVELGDDDVLPGAEVRPSPRRRQRTSPSPDSCRVIAPVGDLLAQLVDVEPQGERVVARRSAAASVDLPTAGGPFSTISRRAHARC